MARSAGFSVTVVIALRGTWAPEEEATWMSFSASGPRRNSGFTSSTTRYWLDCVKMVEISRWPKALYSAVSMAETVTPSRSEEHTSELQSQSNLVCRLLLEKKKKKKVESLSGIECLQM